MALDHKQEAIVVAVRGTLSLKVGQRRLLTLFYDNVIHVCPPPHRVCVLQDVLTDLSADCENLPIEGVTGACYAHKVKNRTPLL